MSYDIMIIDHHSRFIMKRLIHFLLLLAFMATVQAQPALKNWKQLKTGDLIFHVAEEPNQITDVTKGLDNRPIDHVAIFCIVDGAPCVVEAINRGVVITPIDSMRREGYFLVGRIKRNIDRKQSVENALALVGHPYDHLFLPDNNAIYCSELVQLAYVDKRGRRVFGTIPMSFHDESGRITSYWQQFYAERGMEVPEGHPGTNPGELSRRKNVKIIYTLFLS